MGRRGPAATWGRIGPNKEERLSQATQPATQQMRSSATISHLLATNLPPYSPPCSPSRCTCATFWHTYPVNSATVRPRSFFSLSFFLVFLLIFLYSFSFGSFLFLVSFVSFFWFFCPIEMPILSLRCDIFGKSEASNSLIFNILKIAHVTKMANRKCKIAQSIDQNRPIVTFQKKVSY